MKNKITVLLLLTVFSFYCSAQTIPINERFKGGELEFTALMSKKIKYPVKSSDNKVIGYSITGITITPNGDIAEVFTVNPLDDEIDQQVTAALLQTQGYWMKSDTLTTNQTFYAQVIFQIMKLGEVPTNNIDLLDTYNFLEPVFITSLNIKDTVKLKTNESIAIKIDECIKSNKLEEALNYTNELVRRNPFLPGMYQLRISLNQRLKRNDLVTKDVNKLQNFIPGVSLDGFLIAFSEAQEKDRLLAQQTAEKIMNGTDRKVERMPEFPGGNKELMKFINKNLKYPVSDSDEKLQGTVIVGFVVEKDGKIRNAKIVKSVHPLSDAEALRVIRLMPDWIPGIQYGKTVRVFFTLPFRFVMN